MSEKMRLTVRQLDTLKRFDERGLYSPHKTQYRGEERMLERMAKAGLVEAYRHGGFEITNIGRAAIGRPS